MKRRAIYVRWSDACTIGSGDWQTAIPTDSSVIVTTVGVLVRKTKTHLIVTQSFDSNRQPLFMNLFSIPRANVIECRDLEFKE